MQLFFGGLLFKFTYSMIDLYVHLRKDVMAKQLIIIATLLVIFGINSGCSKSKAKNEVDAADPVLSITLPDDDNYQYRTGNKVKFSATVSDDLALDNLVISLAWHGTTKSADIEGVKLVTSIIDPWEVAPETIELSGKTQTFTNKEIFSAEIPSNIKYGFYKLTFELTDAAGKKATEVRIIQIL